MNLAASLHKCRRAERRWVAGLQRQWRLADARRQARAAHTGARPRGCAQGRRPAARRVASASVREDPDPHIGSAPPAAVANPTAAQKEAR